MHVPVLSREFAVITNWTIVSNFVTSAIGFVSFRTARLVSLHKNEVTHVFYSTLRCVNLDWKGRYLDLTEPKEGDMIVNIPRLRKH